MSQVRAGDNEQEDSLMEWKDYAATIKEVLPLEDSPVAITYSMEPPAEASARKIQMLGATCYQAVTYPLTAGELNVSLMDYTSRRIRGFKSSDLLVTVPYHRMHGVVRSIEECTAGTAKMEIPDAFRRTLKEDVLKELEE